MEKKVKVSNLSQGAEAAIFAVRGSTNTQLGEESSAIDDKLALLRSDKDKQTTTIHKGSALPDSLED